MRALLDRRRAAAECGQASLEFVGTLFMWLVIVLVTLQILLAMFALAQANSAARNAARSEVISAGSGQAAGRNAVADPLKRSGVQSSCSTTGGSRGSVTCRVSITVPMLGLHWIPQWVPPLVVTRQAVQPMTEVR